MQFTIDRDGGGAVGAQAAGQGLGNIFKAYMLGPQMREKARMDTEEQLAGTFAKTMQGQQFGAHARKLTADATDQEMTTKLREGIDADLAANPNLPAYERALRIGFKFAGPQHMQNWSAAAVNEKKIADLAAVQADPALAQATGMAYAATQGKPMFSAVSDTGASLNQFTGEQPIANPVLAKLFGEKRLSEAAENRAQANSYNASASSSRATAGLTAEKLRFLQERGFLPGTGDSGENYAINPVLSRMFRVPVLDAKGNQMMDTDGRPMMTADQEGMRQLFQWMQANGKTNANAAIVEWEALGRPKVNQAPGAGQTPAAPAGKVQETATLDGKTYQKVNGQWFEAAAPGQAKAAPSKSQFKSAEDVQRAYKGGTLTRESALQILQRDFGMEPPVGGAPAPAQAAAPAAPLKAAPAAPVQATPAPATAAKSVASVLGVDSRDNALNAIMKAKAQRIEAAAADAKAARDMFAAAARSGDQRAMQAYQTDMLAKAKAFGDMLADMQPQQAQAVRTAVGL